MFLTACNSQTDSDDTVVQIYTVSKIWYHQTTVDNFNNNCPILLIFLVQTLLGKYAVKQWFIFQPHLLSVLTLPYEILKS